MLAITFSFVTLVFWLFGGPNLGRTRTAITLWAQHPATGVPGPVRDRRFVPGVDFLAGSWAVAGALFAVSFLVPKPK